MQNSMMILTDHFRYQHHLRDQLIFLISRHTVNVLLMIELDTQGQVIELSVYIKTFISSISTLRNEYVGLCIWWWHMEQISLKIRRVIKRNKIIKHINYCSIILIIIMLYTHHTTMRLFHAYMHVPSSNVTHKTPFKTR